MSTSPDTLYDLSDKVLECINTKNATKSVGILRILFWVVSAILVFIALWYSISTLLQTPAEILEIENSISNVGVKELEQIKNAPVSEREISLLKKTAMFGEFGSDAKNKKEEKVEAKKSELHLELIGTFVSGKNSQAIIVDKKKKSQEVFLNGEDIFSQAKLIKIFPNKVEIEHDGVREFLIIDEGGSTQDNAATGSSEDDQFVIDEKELNDALDNLPLLLTQARAVPYFKNGKAIGLRLFAIKTGSMYEKIGLKNGDILKAINDNSLADMSQAMKLFEKLREERSLNIVLERNREEKRFGYSIR